MEVSGGFFEAPGCGCCRHAVSAPRRFRERWRAVRSMQRVLREGASALPRSVLRLRDCVFSFRGVPCRNGSICPAENLETDRAAENAECLSTVERTQPGLGVLAHMQTPSRGLGICPAPPRTVAHAERPNTCPPRRLENCCFNPVQLWLVVSGFAKRRVLKLKANPNIRDNLLYLAEELKGLRIGFIHYLDANHWPSTH